MNKIKKIIIFSNPECDYNFEYAKKIADLAKKSDIKVYVDEKYRKELEGFEIDFIECRYCYFTRRRRFYA